MKGIFEDIGTQPEGIHLSRFDRAQKKLAVTASWENSKKAAKEAELRKIEVNTGLL